MSAAPDWPTLLEFETQWDAALPQVLAPFAAAPFSLSLYGDASTEVLVAPRIEFQFILLEPAGPDGEIQLLNRPDLAARPTAYKFNLRFSFVFDSVKVTTAQRKTPGALRDLLAPPAPGSEGAFTSAILPWLCITALGETRSARGAFKDEKEKLLSVWNSEWTGIFSLRESALPA